MQYIKRPYSRVFVILIVIVLILLALFARQRIPEEEPKQQEEKKSQAKQTQPAKNPQPPKAVRQLPGTLVNGSDTGKFDNELPGIDIRNVNARAYLKLILARGGRLYLTRGGQHTVVGAYDSGLAPYVISNAKPLPAGIARDVSQMISDVAMGTLPFKASRAILLWPDNMQQSLTAKLKTMPFASRARKIRADYLIDDGKLMVVVHEIQVDNAWIAVSEHLQL